MAGSYGHVDFLDGKWSLIENMGDAYECVEELLWLVGYFAAQNLRHNRQTITPKKLDEYIRRVLDKHYYPMKRGEQPKDAVLVRVDAIMENRLPYLGDEEL